MDSGVAGRGRGPGRRLRRVRALLAASVLATPLLTGAAAGQDGPASGAVPNAAPQPKPGSAKPAPSKPAAPDPAFEAARAAFEALPEPDRKALQDALVWTGDFNAVVSGAFGRRTFDALQAFRARSGGDPLDPHASGWPPIRPAAR